MTRKPGPKAPSKKVARIQRRWAQRPEPPPAFYSPEVAEIYRRKRQGAR